MVDGILWRDGWLAEMNTYDGFKPHPYAILPKDFEKGVRAAQKARVTGKSMAQAFEEACNACKSKTS